MKDEIFFSTALLYEMVYNKVFIELEKKEKKGKQKGPSTTENSRNNQKGIMELMNGCMADRTEAVENSGDDDGWTEVKSKARGMSVDTLASIKARLL